MDLVGIEIEESRERLSGAGAVAGAIQRDGEEIARAAFRGKQLDGLAQRRNRRGLVVVFQKQHAQVHVGGGHSRIEPSGALVFGLRLLWLLERRVNISKLKMAVGQVRLISENLLERRDGGRKLLFVNIALRLVEQVVERIGKLLRFRLAERLRLRGPRSLRRQKRFPLKRGFVVGASRQRLRRSREEKDKHGTEKRECGISCESREHHGSAEAVLFPFVMVAEPPLGLDAPFGGRFARPFGA